MWLSRNDEYMARIFSKLFDMLNYIVHELLLEHLIDLSFRNQPSESTPTSKDTIDSLKCYKCEKSDLMCCICQDTIDMDTNTIELPCGHTFHGSDCVCPGLMPWLLENNTCPMCKFKLPSDETCEQTISTDSNDIAPLLENEVDEIVNNIIIGIMSGNVPNLQDINRNNMNLIDQMRESLNNSI
jgi:hypothetical protein